MRLGHLLPRRARLFVVGLGWISLIAYAATSDAATDANARPALAAMTGWTAPAPAGAAVGGVLPAPHRAMFARPAAGGLVIGIDRETGLLVMPEPEQLARLLAARAPRAFVARPAPVHHPDGTSSLDVHEWMREYLVVGLGGNGRPTLRCVSGREAAARAVREPAAPAQLEEQ